MVGKDWEVYMTGFILGIVLGPLINGYRAFFAAFVPKGHEAEFYSFYAISDKGSSWFGPLIVAGIRQATGTMRWAILYLSAFALLAIPMLQFMVDENKGIVEAEDFLEIWRNRKKSGAAEEIQVGDSDDNGNSNNKNNIKNGNSNNKIKNNSNNKSGNNGDNNDRTNNDFVEESDCLVDSASKSHSEIEIESKNGITNGAKQENESVRKSGHTTNSFKRKTKNGNKFSENNTQNDDSGDNGKDISKENSLESSE